MPSELKAKLKKISKESQLNPDMFWIKRARADLLNRITPAEQATRIINVTISQYFNVFKSLVPQTVKAAVRPVFTVMLVMAVSVLGWGASVNASYSLPGDSLYGVKMAKEATQVAVGKLVGGAEVEAQLLGGRAKNRAFEAKALVQQNKLEKVDETLNNLTKTVEKANLTLAGAGENEPEKMAKMAADLSETVASISATLKETANSATDSAVVEMVSGVKQQVTDKAIEAVGMVVDKREKGELVQATAEEVNNLVQKTIENLAGDVKDAAAITDNFKQTLGEAGTQTVTVEISSSTLQIGLANPIVSSTVSEASTSTNSGISKVGVDAVKIVAEAAQGQLEQAKQLASEGQLSEALQMVKDVSTGVGDINKGINKAVVEQKILESATTMPSNVVVSPVVSSTAVIAPTVTSNTTTQVVVPTVSVNTVTTKPAN